MGYGYAQLPTTILLTGECWRQYGVYGENPSISCTDDALHRENVYATAEDPYSEEFRAGCGPDYETAAAPSCYNRPVRGFLTDYLTGSYSLPGLAASILPVRNEPFLPWVTFHQTSVVITFEFPVPRDFTDVAVGYFAGCVSSSCGNADMFYFADPSTGSYTQQAVTGPPRTLKFESSADGASFTESTLNSAQTGDGQFYTPAEQRALLGRQDVLDLQYVLVARRRLRGKKASAPKKKSAPVPPPPAPAWQPQPLSAAATGALALTIVTVNWVATL